MGKFSVAVIELKIFGLHSSYIRCSNYAPKGWLAMLSSSIMIKDGFAIFCTVDSLKKHLKWLGQMDLFWTLSYLVSWREVCGFYN